VILTTDRRNSIGGSDVAAVLGLDPRKTALDLWKEKLLGADAIDSPALRRGKFLEPAVLRRHWLGKPGLTETQFPIRRDQWRSGSLDGVFIGPDSKVVAVEIKTLSQRVFDADWGEPGTDDVPDRVLCQTLWYADLADAERSEVVAAVLPEDPDMVLGLTADEVAAVCDLHVYPIARAPATEALIVERARHFWFVNVKQELPPDRVDLEDAKKLWRRALTSKCVEATADDIRLVQELEEHQQAKRDADASIKAIQFQLAERIRDNEGLAIPNVGPILTWKEQARCGFTVEPTQFRVFRTTKWWKKVSGAGDS
jgi:putative phage-type endonuclease